MLHQPKQGTTCNTTGHAIRKHIYVHTLFKLNYTNTTPLEISTASQQPRLTQQQHRYAMLVNMHQPLRGLQLTLPVPSVQVDTGTHPHHPQSRAPLATTSAPTAADSYAQATDDHCHSLSQGNGKGDHPHDDERPNHRQQ